MECLIRPEHLTIYTANAKEIHQAWTDLRILVTFDFENSMYRAELCGSAPLEGSVNEDKTKLLLFSEESQTLEQAYMSLLKFTGSEIQDRRGNIFW